MVPAGWLDGVDGIMKPEVYASMWLDLWIEREFTGYGVAIRAQSDSPIPGEPLMSMAIAKELTRQAVAEANKMWLLKLK